ncbi:glycoside hydrolase family 16 protein [Reinekea marinisedimentorum]|uniref:Glycosyl hydrolase family 16 n=1 Tax=Reinekea marinisedimentorum TaxID=230495 RepID=A0A4R3I586_9GAMM|nr:glycoside hydrolase family 16 protein [Reinekea marinisedimentorum]TCS41123.1 glycosyl hydrolase family 16 [Reinekea marinisedimentorum]
MQRPLPLISTLAIATGALFCSLPAQAADSDPSLYGAELYSLDTVLYGKFVFRMKMQSEPGVVSSFFTYDNQSWQGKGIPWREIDFETIGIRPDLLQTNIITGDLSSRVTTEHEAEVENIGDYHTYTLEWTPDAVIWKVDGVAVRTELAANSQQVIDLRDTPQTYRSNIWISDVPEWVGEIDLSHLPLYQAIDWMEYYSYSKDAGFALQWRDDFDSFDHSRWAKGNWTFDTNRVTFAPENLQVINGELVFALTAGNKGF